MYLDIYYYIYIYSKIDVLKKVKMTYNLERSEYIPSKLLPLFPGVYNSSFWLCL